MKSLAPVMQANRMVGEIDWDANLRTLYYDLAGAHSPEVIRMLLSITTPDHLLYGSDFPYAAPQVLTSGLQRMKQYLTTEPDLAPFREMILWKNARWLFSQTEEKPSAGPAAANMIVRIAEIEVYPQHLEEYLAFANEVDRLSIEREPGVICLFPMQSAEDSCRIRILEIYASEEVYQEHLKTDHFQKYKQGTLHMVKNLKLPTMKPLDPETMKQIFRKK
jgi:quinol monooxygenase YgiN